MVHEAARTLMLQQQGAAASSGVDFNSWLITTILPLWIVAQVVVRSWGLLWRFGKRRAESDAHRRRAFKPAPGMNGTTAISLTRPGGMVPVAPSRSLA